MMKNNVIIMAVELSVFLIVGFVTTCPNRRGGFCHLKRGLLSALATVAAIGVAVMLFPEWGNIAAFLETRMADSMDPAWGVIMAPAVIVVVAVLYGALLASMAKIGISLKKALLS